VVCYWGSWTDWRFDFSSFNASLCSDVIYSFVNVAWDTTISAEVATMRKFAAMKFKHPQTNFLAAAGGWNAGAATFERIAGDRKLREKFGKNVLKFVERHKLDGFDFDFEYPVDKENFIQLLIVLRDKLASPLIFSVAVGATEWRASQSYDIPRVAANVDFISLMTYDLHGVWDQRTGINSPLYRGPDDDPTTNVDVCVKHWLKQGAPREKLIVGIPLYGRSFTLKTGDTSIGASITGPGTPGSVSKEAGILTYFEICKNNWPREWQSEQFVPYAFDLDQWVGYDDVDSVKFKSDYINNNQLGGAMFWSIESDDYANACGQGTFPLISKATILLREGKQLRSQLKLKKSAFERYFCSIYDDYQ